jgi:hypothetical protein
LSAPNPPEIFLDPIASLKKGKSAHSAVDFKTILAYIMKSTVHNHVFQLIFRVLLDLAERIRI